MQLNSFSALRRKKIFVEISAVMLIFVSLNFAHKIDITNPLFGDILFTNDMPVITWRTEYGASDFRLELYKGKIYLLTITPVCNNSYCYQWNIPADILSGEDYQIKITDLNNPNNYCFSGYFRIVSKCKEDNPIAPPTEYNQSWEISTVDNSADVGYFTGIDFDNLNRPHISYYDNSNGDLKYAYWNGTTWVIQTIDAGGNVGKWTSIAVNRANNNVHISYCDDGNRDLKYALWNGVSWSTVTVDATGNRGEYTDIALDTYGNPHISYIYGGSGDLMYAFKTGAIWGTVCVDDANDTGRYTGIDLDNNNYPHFSYHDYTWYRYWCKYAYYSGSGWPKQWVDQRSGTGYYTSIGVDNNSTPHISYQGASHCDYARYNGSNWELTSVDPHSGDLYIGGTSIAFDALGRPHIAYYRASSTSQGRLGYAYWNNTGWVTEVPDSNGSVGGHPSIAIDNNNCIHISYVDWSNTALKYAKKVITGIIEQEKSKIDNKRPILAVPNPISGDRITISYRLTNSGYTHLNLYNSMGERVKTLSNSQQDAGLHKIVWDRRDENGKRLPNGVYFITLHTEYGSVNTKIILIE
ncbi:MAG: FlgD immunoglobulin-like domain containing protein [candidate division WOR-3 bacterium]